MTRGRIYAILAGLGLVAVLSLALSFWAFSPGPTGVPVAGVPASPSAGGLESAGVTAPAAKTHDPDLAGFSGVASSAVTVHAHWTIEIREADGTLVSRREFDNKLIPDSGGNWLSFVLGGGVTPGVWRIVLIGSGNDQPCFVGQDSASVCVLVEATSQAAGGANVFTTLTTATPTSGDNRGKLVLSATASAQRDSKIFEVRTENRYCIGAGTTPAACKAKGGETINQFTSFTLQSPETVLKDQKIEVTVAIDFS